MSPESTTAPPQSPSSPIVSRDHDVAGPDLEFEKKNFFLSCTIPSFKQKQNQEHSLHYTSGDGGELLWLICGLWGGGQTHLSGT